MMQTTLSLSRLPDGVINCLMFHNYLHYTVITYTGLTSLIFGAFTYLSFFFPSLAILLVFLLVLRSSDLFLGGVELKIVFPIHYVEKRGIYKED